MALPSQEPAARSRQVTVPICHSFLTTGPPSPRLSPVLGERTRSRLFMPDTGFFQRAAFPRRPPLALPAPPQRCAGSQAVRAHLSFQGVPLAPLSEGFPCLPLLPLPLSFSYVDGPCTSHLAWHLPLRHKHRSPVPDANISPSSHYSSKRCL